MRTSRSRSFQRFSETFDNNVFAAEKQNGTSWRKEQREWGEHNQGTCRERENDTVRASARVSVCVQSLDAEKKRRKVGEEEKEKTEIK